VTEINNAVLIADDGNNGEDPTPDNNSDDEITPVGAAPDMTITKVDDVAETTAPGATIIYTLTYDNVGDQDATGVVVTETVPANTTFTTTSSSAGWACTPDATAGSTCTLTLGAVPASDPAATLTFAVVVDDPLAAGVTEINNAVSIADDGNNGDDPTPNNNSDDEVTPLDAAPDIAVQKTNGVNQTAPGANLTYTIIVSNLGNQDATGVTLEDTIPTGTSFVEADNAGVFDEGSGVVTWPVFDLAAGESRTFTMTLLVDNPLDPSIVSLLNMVVANDDGTNGEDPDDENNTDTDIDVIGMGYKQVNVDDLYNEDNPSPAPGSALTVRIGDVITYEVGLLVGEESILENLVMTDILDRGLAFIDCEIVAEGLTEDPLHPFDQICNSMLVETEPTGSVNPADPGRKLTLTFGTISNESEGDQFIIVRYRVKVLNSVENVRGLLLNNAAEWNWTGGNLELKAENVKVVEPELLIEKSVNPQTGMSGQELTFTLKIRHSENSNVNAYDVVLEDVIPLGLRYVPGSLTFVDGQEPTSLDDSAAPRLQISWDVFRLTAQETVVTYKASISNLGPGQSATNTATLEWSSLPDSSPVPASPYNPTLSTERTYIPDSNVDIYGASSSAVVNVPELPMTGFQPGVVTPLPQMPFNYAYAQTGGMLLNIPKLGLNTGIIGIPLQDGEWNLTWLGKQAGYLEGTTFPTWNGNSAITAHVSNADGTPGPFAALGSLKWGDTIEIYAYGQVYSYSVREIKQTTPNDTSVFKSEDRSWLTLLTCRGYDEATDTYDYRIVVRAVLIGVSEQ
jgi:LPXTG-site transpeptidase (sortase) family protein